MATPQLDIIAPHLRRTEDDPRPVVVVMCGISGAGKTTLSKAIAAEYPNFARLSVDETVEELHGLWGKDYAPESYAGHLDDANTAMRERLVALLGGGRGARDAVVDRAFYEREERETWRRLIEDNGGRRVLVFLQPASVDVVWERVLRRRAAGVDANSARDISRDLLESFWEGFENPEGEGEIVIHVD